MTPFREQTPAKPLANEPRDAEPVHDVFRPAIEAGPRSVHLGFSDTSEPGGSSEIVTLHHADRRPFRVTGLEVSDPTLLHASLIAGGEPSSQHIIRIGLQGTELAKAQCGTVRTRLLKIGAQVRVSVRKVWISFSEAFPLARLFVQALHNIQAQPVPIDST